MGTEGLKIVIGADIGSAIVGISKLTDAMQGISDASGDAASALNKIPASLRPIDPAKMQSLSAAVQKLKQDISGFPKNPIPDPFKNLPKGANQAAAALTNVGRVAQDLPFGFVGIQNNLNPLLESFQRLKAETGSGKAAFLALGQSLIGPAGIGLALSIVSGAILIFQNGISGFNKKTKEAKQAADDLADAIKTVAVAEGEAAASVQGDITKVNALASVLTDANKPYNERKRALEELKEVNKAYFGDLKLEDALTGKLAATVQEYTKALINSAIQKEFASDIARVAKSVVDNDNEIEKSRNKLVQANSEVEKAEQRLLKARSKALNQNANAQGINSGVLDAQNAVNAALVKQSQVVDELNDKNDKSTQLLEQQALLTNKLNHAVLEGLKFKDLDSKTGKKDEDFLKKQLDLLEKIRDAAKENQGKMFFLQDVDEATDKLADLEQQVGDLKLKIAVRDAKKAGLPAAEIEKLKDAIKKDTEERLNNAFEKEALLLEFNPKLKFSQVNRAEISGNVDSQIAKATGFDKKIPTLTIPEVRLKLEKAGLKFRIPVEILNAMEQINAKLQEQVKGIFENGLSDVFSGIGEGFGEALGASDFGDGLKKAAQNIVSIVGSVMQQLGKALIAAAIKIKLLKETFEKWAIANPALAIIAGIGLVAAGAALKNIKFEGPKFADGGIVTGPVIGQVGERFKPEIIMPLDRLPQLFKQFGDVGGGLQLVPIINNEGLFLAMKRGERSAGRKF